MPNWCCNSVKITASKNDLEAFIQKMGSFLSFEKIDPTPSELLAHNFPLQNESLKKEFLAKYGESDWYNWRVNNWGTKWDLDERDFAAMNPEGLVIEKNCISLFFDTAWAPPIKALEKLTKQFPSMKIGLKYYESGAGFAGETEISDGNSIDTEYKHDSKEYNEIADAFDPERGMWEEEEV
jgi:hypothetical protein